MDLQYVLTADDPSDLPRASIDPLGFDRVGSSAPRTVNWTTMTLNRPSHQG